jgi:hypothetical protein
MALSQQVEESLKEAEGHLRNALAFAARNEKPFVNKQIAEMIAGIDHLISLDNLFDMLDNRIKGNSDDDRPSGKMPFKF